MATIFRDPIGWAAGSVGSTARLALTFSLQAVLTAGIIYYAAQEGVRAVFGMGLFLIWMQFLWLYALQALYRRLAAREGAQ